MSNLFIFEYRLDRLILRKRDVLKVESKLKANLVNLDNGYYLSKNDPLFWQKLFQRQPDNAEALYHVGAEMEIEAKKYLVKYYSTRVEKYLILYRKAITQSLNLVKRSFNKGFVPARSEILRMEQEREMTEKQISDFAKPTSFSKHQIIFLFLVAIILSVLGTVFLLPYKFSKITNYSNNNYTYMLPYEVIESKPTNSEFIPEIQSKIILDKGVNRQQLVNELIGKLRTDYEKDPGTSKQVLALDENYKEIGMAVWEGVDKNIQVYVYPESEVAMSNVELQLWETTTVVRSALYQFIKKNGYMPKDLNVLTQSFPNNYLSEFPKEPFHLKNTVTTSLTRDGGWFFSYVEYPNKKDLASVVKNVLKPNLPYDQDIPFMPLCISINMESNRLSVVSEDRIIRRYNVGLGKDDTTPEGDLLITKKVMNPDKMVPLADNVYGTRAMELSDIKFALHGTNSPSSIGKNISMGCIRLNNSDMEELYAITPLNTAVKISKNPPSTISNESDLYSPNKDLYYFSDDLIEEDLFTRYHWAN